MSALPPHTSPVPSLVPYRCPACGAKVAMDAARCPACQTVLIPGADSGDERDTQNLRRRPQTSPTSSSRSAHFSDSDIVVLQLLPSGTCLMLPLDKPVTLGRGPSGSVNGLDLSEFNAAQHGVSRQHCLLRRSNNELILTDLGSTNGTLLNSEPVEAHFDYVISNGDRLILGTLHLSISFAARPDD